MFYAIKRRFDYLEIQEKVKDDESIQVVPRANKITTISPLQTPSAIVIDNTERIRLFGENGKLVMEFSCSNADCDHLDRVNPSADIKTAPIITRTERY